MSLETRCHTTESQPPLRFICTSLDIEVRDPNVYAQRATMPAESGPPMTRVGRFTVWVIVAVIAIMVVYFMAYSGMDQASPAAR